MFADFSIAYGFGLRSERVTVGTIDWNSNVSRIVKSSGLAFLPSMFFITSMGIGSRAEFAFCTSFGRAKFYRAPV